jgi:hypothetical protein
MKLVTVHKWQLRCDPDATRQVYLRLTSGYADACGCLDCRNFIASRPLIFHGERLDLLEKLGIDPSRETQIYKIGSGAEGFYEGSFHFVGSIEVPQDPFVDPDLPLDPDFRFFFHCSGRVPEAFAGLEAVALNFRVVVPWVIDQPPEA